MDIPKKIFFFIAFGLHHMRKKKTTKPEDSGVDAGAWYYLVT